MRSAPQKNQRVIGDDRLLFIEDLSKFGAREVISAVPFVPQFLPRLSLEAEAWQRIRYRTLRFVLVPRVGTAAAGGFTTSFVKDSTDPIPHGEAGLQRLFAQDSAILSPLWETAAIDVGGLTDKYYTNWDSQSPRWSSPGQLVVMTEGKPSVSGSATIYCEYDVTFFAADVDTEEVQIGVGSIVKVDLSSSTDKTPHLGMAAEKRNLQFNGSETPNWNKIFPGTVKGDVLKLPSPPLLPYQRLERRFRP